MITQLNLGNAKVTKPTASTLEAETTLEPCVTIDVEEVERRRGFAGGVPVSVVDVVNEAGEKARFFVSVTMKNGRPVAIIATKPDKYRQKQVTKSIMGTFNII